MKQTLPTSVVPADMQRIREQMQDYITDAAALPISFICGGERIKGLPARFSPRVKEERKGDVIERTFTGKDETGLEITVVTTEYTDFPVAEIVAYFRGGARYSRLRREIQRQTARPVSQHRRLLQFQRIRDAQRADGTEFPDAYEFRADRRQSLRRGVPLL